MTQHNNFSPGDAAPKLVSPEEQRTIAQSNHDLDARYSSEAIERRVAELGSEAELLRKLRRNE
jgi:hypothetical protein